MDERTRGYGSTASGSGPAGAGVGDPWREMVDASPDLVCLLDAATGTILQVNDTWTRRLGHDPDSVARKPLLDLVHPDDRGEAPFLEARSSGEAAGEQSAMIRLRSAAGEHRWTEWRCSPERDGTRVAIGRDVGELRDVLTKSRRRSRLLDRALELGGAGQFDLDPRTGRFTSSSTLDSVLGLGPGFDRTVDGWASLLHPDERDEVVTELRTALRPHQPPFDRDYRIRTLDGEEKWVHGYGELELDGDGRPARFFGLIQDITERREREQELHEQSERLRQVAARAGENLAKFRTLFEIQPVGVSLTDEEGALIEMNSTARRILGMDSSEHNSRSLDGDAWTIIRPDGTPMPPEEYASVIALREKRWVEGVEMGVYRPDGSLRWLSVSAAPVEYPGLGVMISYVDVTDIKEREVRFRTLFDSMHDIVFTLDADLRHTAVYGTWVDRLGVAPDHFLGRSAEDLLEPEEAAAHTAAARRALAGEHVVYDWSHPSDDGARHVQTSLSPITDSAGRVHGVVGVGRDITERVELERSRLEMQKRMVELQKAESLAVLAGGVAHDFNNLLIGVLGNAELAALQLEEGGRAAGFIEAVIASAEQAADLARQMLAYSGKGRLHVELVDPNEVLQGMRSILRAAVDPNVGLDLRTQPDIPAVRADATQLRQVVHNLVLNAAEALRGEPGTVFVTTSETDFDPAGYSGHGDLSQLEAGRFVEITVRDTGKGMDAGVAERVFEPFFSTKFTGRGLGLAAAQGIMRGHDGAILFETARDRGTTFRLLFPVAATSSPSTESPDRETGISTPPAAEASRGTILLVDDEEVVRTTTTTMLEQLGYRVLSAADGMEALELWDTHGPQIDAVVLDMMMPRLDGQDTFTVLRSESPDLPILRVSGYDEQHIIATSRGDASAPFLQKPFRLGPLREKLEELLDER